MPRFIVKIQYEVDAENLWMAEEHGRNVYTNFVTNVWVEQTEKLMSAVQVKGSPKYISAEQKRSGND